VKSFLAAAADGDGRKACGLTDAAGRRRLEKAAGGRVGCERVIAVFAQRLPANVKTGLRSVEVGRVRIEGDRATVTDLRQSKGGTLPSGTPIVLAKHGGDWKVSGD
jgi:hypothetical protein